MTVLTKTFVALSLFVTAFSSTAMADTYQHIDQLALHIERQAKTLISESTHYRHTSEYRHVVSDARELAGLAEHMHELAHHHGSLAHLSSDLRELDSKFHHIESLFDRIEHGAAYGHGHVHGNTSHVKSLLNSIANDIHHLEADLAALRVPVRRTPAVVTGPFISTPSSPYSSQWGGYNNFPQHSQHSNFGHSSSVHGSSTHGTHGRSSRGRTFSFGGGSSRFNFRF